MNQAVTQSLLKSLLKSPLKTEPSSFWIQANQRLLAKSLSELSWEEAISPLELDNGDFTLELQSGTSYQFTAWRTIWDQLIIDPASIIRTGADGQHWSSPDVSQLFIDARTELRLTSVILANFLEELANTLMAEVRVQQNYHKKNAAELIDLTDDELQCYLDGHPKVTVSKGRIGWGFNDYEAYATEFLPDIQLEWLAVSREHCQLSRIDDLSEQALLSAVLDMEAQAKLLDVFHGMNLTVEAYFLMPVHPWQWQNKLVNLFAGEIAAGRIVHLGAFGDPMLPQQSLRTLSNRQRPKQLNIKLPLSILNTSCYRGIPGQYIKAGPMISRWLANIVDSDPTLANRGVIVLEEPAGAFYPNPIFTRIEDAPYRYHEMLGCIWRQSVHDKIKASERAVLISTLFQRDGFDEPLIHEYIRRSGLSARQWLTRLFDSVVIPLYHLLCKYGVGLVAHGQNVTVVLEQHQPARVALKDFQGDLRLIDQDFPELDSLSDYARSVTTRLPAEYLIHDLQTGHFVSVLRFISSSLAEKGLAEKGLAEKGLAEKGLAEKGLAEKGLAEKGFSEVDFYGLLGKQLQLYMKAHPELNGRFKLFDLFQPEMARVCLNRVRFKQGYGDASERPLPELGTPLNNPLATTFREVP